MVPRASRKVDQSDQDFVDILRAAVAAYLQAVDEWEATYNRYYRLPGHAHVVSSDMESEQREFEAQRLALSSLLPRAGQLCLKHGLLRAAVAAYLQAVDEWEATYNRYYRLPGHAHVVSSDMESEQREFEAQRLALSSLLPRAGQLCLKHGLANPFPRLLRSSLGQYAPQQRVESAVSRNERNSVTTCLEQLTDACRGCPPSARPVPSAREVRPSEAPVARRTRGWVILTVTVGAFAAMTVGVNWLSRRLPAARNLDQQPYGKRSGDDLRASWEAERKKESARFTDADLQRMVDQLFVEDDPGRANFHGLLYAGARPLPFLLKALDDPRMSTIVFDKKGFDPIEMSPFGSICSLL